MYNTAYFAVANVVIGTFVCLFVAIILTRRSASRAS